ncbi:MAG: hypothetical protein M8353_10655, partial [ANME-2 cluster archaeon]|nr:hypothetical protein [ANME-2 cluster archaeon]
HGPMHNITKPDPSAGTLGPTEDSHCTTCHQSYTQHNTTVACTDCHTEDVHVIKYFDTSGGNTTTKAQAGNCSTCHQKSSMDSRITSPRTPPKVRDTTLHSSNSYNGTLWDSGTDYWTNTTEKSRCYYCHGNTTHNSVALGYPDSFKGSNTVGSTLDDSTWCAACHYSGFSANYNNMLATMSPVPPNITANLSGTGDDGTTYYYNHTLQNYYDSRCVRCHWNSVAAKPVTISALMHNVSASIGGPDCVSCHDLGKDEPRVDVSAMNASISIHANLNSGAADTTGNTDNKMCWGCHQTDGTQPLAHPDKMDIPYTCYECHDGSAPAHVSGALTVSEHFKSGTDIQSLTSATDDSASCVSCHSLSEMRSTTYTEPSSTDLTNNSLAAHYGIQRGADTTIVVGGVVNCSYCHMDTNTVFEFASAARKDMKNHTDNAATTPGCTNANCHNTGRMHDSSLAKPALSDTLCKTCHNTKSEHNGASAGVYCLDCHNGSAAPVSDIHDIKFIQTDDTYVNNTNNAAPANCTSCHQQTLAASGNFTDAPGVNDPMMHSNDILNGSKWGTYWNTTTAPNSSCWYCHGDSRHNATALGNIDNFRGGNAVGAVDLATTTWCLGCHLNGSTNYNTMLGNMSPVPPSVTNVSNDPNYPGGNAVDHTDANFVKSNDDDCASCHAGDTTNATTFMHNLSAATGCTACHEQPPNGSVQYNTRGAHVIHNSSIFQTYYGALGEDIGCNYCHNGAGSSESHPQYDGSADVSTNGSATISTYNLNASAGNDDTCSGVSCHANSAISASANVGTALWNATLGCDNCHSTQSTGLPPTGNHSVHNTTEGYTCDTCHGAGASTGTQTAHKTNATIDIDFTGLASSGSIASGNCTVYCHSPNPTYDPKPTPTWNITNVTCGDCHSIPPTPFTTRNNVAHTTSTNCDSCHGANASTGSHTSHINGSIEASAGGPNCVSCHNGAGANKINMTLFTQSPHMNISNGNATNNKQCYTCHRDGTAPSEATGQAEHTSKTIRYNASNLSCADSACHGN